MVGSLAERVKKSSVLVLDGNEVIQSEDGALTLHFWHNHSSLIPKRNEIPPKKAQDVKASSSKANDETSCTHRTNKWVGDLDYTNGNAKSSDLNWNEVAPLQNLLYEVDSRYSFFLITGKNTPADKYNGIANIPWLKVFDFDTESRSTGLLSLVEKNWQNTRLFSISTCSLHQSKALQNDCTDWFFPLGCADLPNSHADESPLSWFNNNKALLEKQFVAIANFCAARTVPVFLILWYDSEKRNVKYLNWILSVLYPAFKFDSKPKQIILCLDSASFDNGSMEEVISTYELQNSTIQISPETTYKWLARQHVPAQPIKDVMRLPKANGEKIVEISDKKWILSIQQCIEILWLESQDQIASRKTEDLGKDFVKGSEISWDELANGNLAVPRDGKKSVTECLEEDVMKKEKSVILRLQHAPGGGGTTFARQLLWDLHTKLPCGVVVPNVSLSISQISEGVRALYDKTHLPIVLLIDGRSEFEVDQIYENCKYAVVILHVQRCSKKISKNEFVPPLSRTFHLSGKVTPTEATNLTEVFSLFSPESENALQDLTKDVKNSKERFVFEYGLAAFDHEFKGVRKYVQGYLKLDEQKDGIKNLHNWQRVIGYLSLALYYGQSGIHRETFRSLLEVQKFVSLKHLEYSGSQFIVETKEWKKENRGEWKISYNIVAKEILEQILSSCTYTNELCDPELSSVAKVNLHELVTDFILLIKTAAKGNTPENLVQLLSNMIIRRNYSEVDKSDGIKKNVLSKLLEDIPVKENRVYILRLLTEAFPQNAEFHAHLGRLLNIMKNFSLAEQSLQTAYDLRIEECSNLGPNSTDDMLSRIHHMFGVGYSQHAQEERTYIKKHDRKKYQSMLEYVKKAVNHFGEARRYATHNLSYGYLGEIHVRLLVAEYVNGEFPDGCQKAFDYTLGSKHLEISEFVRESHSVCDKLLAETLLYTSEQELGRINTYRKCIEKFTRVYGKIKKDMPMWRQNNTAISMQRSQITSLKMSNRSDKGKNDFKRPSIDNIKSPADLHKIIELYERIFRQVFGGGLTHESISVDVMEWLEAIRHPLGQDEYTLLQILETIKNWENKNEPGYATFYLYVVNFVLAVFSAGENLNKFYYGKASELKDKLQAQRYKCDIKFWRLEWIAKHDNPTSVKKLIHQNRLGLWDKDLRFWRDEMQVRKLEVFTGTIIQSSHPLKGTIALDVFQANYKCRIDVYFVPKLYGLDRSYYADQKQRVEFCIGFSCQHGAEAFEIRKLEKEFCHKCKVETEFLTINAPASGICRKCVLADKD